MWSDLYVVNSMKLYFLVISMSYIQATTFQLSNTDFKTPEIILIMVLFMYM